MLPVAVVIFMLFAGITTRNTHPPHRDTKWPAHVRVHSKQDEWFSFDEKDPNNTALHSGFLVDLVNHIHEITGTVFTITARPDLAYGRQNENGSWDGTLIAVLLNHQADLAGPSLTITSESEEVVDFLLPLLAYKLTVSYNTEFGYDPANVQYLMMDDEDVGYVKNSKNATLQAIYQSVKSGLPGSLVDGDINGIAEVISGGFAFIDGNPFISKALAKNPEAVKAGKLAAAPGDLGKYFYDTFAVPLGSPLRKLMNVMLLKLIEDGTIQRLMEKYELSY